MQFLVLNCRTNDCKCDLRYFILEYHMRLFTYLMTMILLTFFLTADIDAVFWASMVLVMSIYGAGH